MELFATDLERLAFLLEVDAAPTLDPDALGTEAVEQSDPELRYFGILIKDYAGGEMPGIYCNGGIYAVLI
jgi:hypothetical protein